MAMHKSLTKSETVQHVHWHYCTLYKCTVHIFSKVNNDLRKEQVAKKWELRNPQYELCGNYWYLSEDT